MDPLTLLVLLLGTGLVVAFARLGASPRRFATEGPAGHPAVGPSPGGAAGGPPTADVVWDVSTVTRELRVARLGLRGGTVWLTGLPASGKSTIAKGLEARLVEAGIPAYRLDGDNLRHGLNAGLGFSRDDRGENVRRAAHAARLLADAGVVAVVSLVSPYTSDRDEARALHEQEGIDFVEVWVNTPVEECELRDPKGLYARARAGEIRGLTGVDDPYEAPERADLVLGGGGDAAAAIERVHALLVERGIVRGA